MVEKAIKVAIKLQMSSFSVFLTINMDGSAQGTLHIHVTASDSIT